MSYCNILKVDCDNFDRTSELGKCEIMGCCPHQSCDAAPGAYLVLRLWRRQIKELQRGK